MKIKYQTLFTILCASSLIFSACSSCSDDKSKDTGGSTTPPTITSGDVTVITTTTTRSLDLTKSSLNFSEALAMSPVTITLDPATRYQTIDGFGSAITGSTCFNLLKMNQEDRTKFLKETFSDTEGLGQSYVRIAIGCSDFSLSEYSLCDTKGIENFALQEEETKYIIPILKEILAINPNIKIMGSPWTAPRWMKVNDLKELKEHNEWTSGQLNPAYYADYGTYFVKWIKAMADNGINIYSVTPQNEPLNRGNSASMFMGWEEQKNFLKEGLGPKLKEAGLNTKVYLFDHNFDYDGMSDQTDYPVKIYEDSEAAAYAAGAAYHNYGGVIDELLDIQSKNPEKELVFTETSIGTWNDGKNLTTRLMEDMKQVALGTVNNWCKAVIVWNLMLDSERGPNRDGGCQTCYGAVDIDVTNYKTINKNSHYYIIGHLSSVVKPGATRIGTTGHTADGLVYTAFENTDGTYALILLNDNGRGFKLHINDAKNSFAHDVPAKSVVSYRWKK